ncbi:PH domain-containing protein [Clostridium sp. 19966]|uniref:PH domain-containing protein n=1 Tax=Clostridium sp. 19966 TaxID=2768166 RepID=UPI0028E00A62|nr:PH domain-containing protein [Clostridium sp. 19966]MDT8717227.1 PH domain-containing protein [Clostridium sp. 19966]
MKIFEGFWNSNGDIDIDKLEEELNIILTDGELAERSYLVNKENFIFTNKRMIILERQGRVSKKTKYTSFPYRSITHYSIETEGYVEADAVLTIYIQALNEPIIREFKRDKTIYNIQKALSHYILDI